MLNIFFFILGFVVCVLIVYWLMRRVQNQTNNSGSQAGEQGAVINPEQVKRHQENLAKILEWVKTNGQITNDEVQKLLNVPASTAERYLDELEKSGSLRQIGTTGQNVFYRLK